MTMKKKIVLSVAAALAALSIPVASPLFMGAVAPPPIVRNYFSTNVNLTPNTAVYANDGHIYYDDTHDWFRFSNSFHQSEFYLGSSALYIPRGGLVVGTNTLSAALTLRGNNFLPYLIDVGTTNLPHAFTVDTNGQGAFVSTVKGADPIETNDFATKLYVDNLSQLAFTYYFYGQTNAVLTNGSAYRQMWKSDVPMPAIFTNTFPGLTSSSNAQYVLAYCSPAVNVSSLKAGSYIVRAYQFITGVGGPSLAIAPEIYIRRTTGQEIEIGTGATHPILVGNFEHTFTLNVSTNVTMNLTDSIVVKFKLTAVTGTVSLRDVSQGSTSAGLSVPIVSSSFVLKSGDTMSGNLVVPAITVNSNVHYVLSTNVTIGSMTNFAADFLKSYSDLFAVADLNFTHATNQMAGHWMSKVIKIYAGETNRQIWLPSTWKGIGSAATNYVVMASNKVAILSLASDGSFQTNVCYVYVPQP